MRGSRRSWPLLISVFVSLVVGCGDRDTDAAVRSDSAQAEPPVAAAPQDTAIATSDTAKAPARDTAPAAQRDSTPPPSAGAGTGAPAAAPPRKAAPAPKPRTPKPAAPAATPPDTAPAETPAAPAQAADTAAPATQATAPLRDEYHRPPSDTVSQQVYDGWKQFNLNCARCHGEDVQGTTIAPHLVTSLKPDGPINTKELFVQTVCAGRPEKGMPAWCPLGLEMDKIQAIYSYVKGRSDGKIRPGRPAVKPGG
jgi:hypothetical protein